MNNEIMALYKRNNISPLSGCLSSILQIFVILAVFFVVSKPLTYMRKADKELVSAYTQIVTENNNGVIPGYHEISIVKYVNALDDSTEENKNAKEQLSLNMSFLGLDLSNVPKDHMNNWTVYIIPVLYILTSIISIRLTTKEQDRARMKAKENVTSKNKVVEVKGKEISKNSKEDKAKIVKDDKEKEDEKDKDKDKVKDTKDSKEEKEKKENKESKDNKENKESKDNKEEKALVKKDDKNERATQEDYEESMNQMNKSMLYMMPIMSVMIAFIAPLGLALYWLVSNISMIIERIFIRKILDKEEEKEDGK